MSLDHLHLHKCAYNERSLQMRLRYKRTLYANALALRLRRGINWPLLLNVH